MNAAAAAQSAFDLVALPVGFSLETLARVSAIRIIGLSAVASQSDPRLSKDR